MSVLPWIGFLVLLAFVPTLLFVAHLFALSRQDKHAWFVVVLDNRVHDVAGVSQKQAASYGLKVDRIFDGPVKGYTAFVPLRRLQSLKDDRRVTSVKEQELEEF